MKKIVLIVSFLFLLTAYSVSAQGGAFGLNNSDANSKGANDLFQNFSKKPAEEPTKSFFEQLMVEIKITIDKIHYNNFYSNYPNQSTDYSRVFHNKTS